MNIITAIRRCLLPIFVAMYFVCSLYVMIPFVIGCVGSGYTGLDSSPYGTPSRPMVYRVLMPAMTKVVKSIIPEAIEKPLTAKMIRWRDSEEGKRFVKDNFFRPPPLSDDKIFESGVAVFVAYLTLLAFLWMLYTLARALFPESLAYALLAPLIALQLLPAFMFNNAYIYDFAELFFASALFYLLFKQRWGLYMVTLCVATLNKETTLFAIIFFTAYFYSRLPRGQFIRLLLQQCLMYGAIKGGITLYFAGYPGELIGPHVTLAGNLSTLFHSGDYMYFIIIASFMAYRWRGKPEFLRGGVPMMVVHTAIFFVICIPFEYRDFYASLPLIILYVTHSLIAGAGFADHPLFKASVV